MHLQNLQFSWIFTLLHHNCPENAPTWCINYVHYYLSSFLQILQNWKMIKFTFFPISFDPDKIEKRLIPYNHSMNLGNWKISQKIELENYNCLKDACLWVAFFMNHPLDTRNFDFTFTGVTFFLTTTKLLKEWRIRNYGSKHSLTEETYGSLTAFVNKTVHIVSKYIAAP